MRTVGPIKPYLEHPKIKNQFTIKKGQRSKQLVRVMREKKPWCEIALAHRWASLYTRTVTKWVQIPIFQCDVIFIITHSIPAWNWESEPCLSTPALPLILCTWDNHITSLSFSFLTGEINGLDSMTAKVLLPVTFNDSTLIIKRQMHLLYSYTMLLAYFFCS